MPRYIDADKLLDEEQAREFVVGVRNGKPLLAACKNYLKMVIDNAPTADVEPVVHGRWTEDEICSICGGSAWYYDWEQKKSKSRYCPNCGAKMDGKEKQCG